MEENSGKGLAHKLTEIGARRWPFFVILTAVLIFALSALWFAWLSHVSGGLSILYKLGFVGSACLGVVALIAYRKEIAQHPEKPFLVIILAITCSTSWVYDTNEVSSDIDSHFYYMLAYSEPDRIYECTEAVKPFVVWNEDIVSAASSQTVIEPTRTQMLEDAIASSEDSINHGDYIHTIIDGDAILVKDEVLNELDGIQDDEGEIIIGRLKDAFKHLSSIPASIVYGLLSFLGVSFALKFVLAKMVYAVMYSLILYFGMMKLRSGKLLYAVISLYPTAVFLAANYSYDFWVNAWTMYAVACVVGQLQTPETHVQPKDMLRILGAFLIGFGPKAIYFPLIALVFLLPKAKFSSVKMMRCFRALACLAMVLLVLSFLLPLIIVSADVASDARGGGDVSATGQIAFILAHPLHYLKICFLYMLDYLSILNIKTYITWLGFLGQPAKAYWIVFVIITLFLAVTDTAHDSKLMDRWPTRVYVLCLVLGTLVLAMTALYVSFTPVGLDTVKGFQGRYFLPFLFLLLVFMGTKRFAWPPSPKQQTIVGIAVLFIVLAVNYCCIWDVYVGLLN